MPYSLGGGVFYTSKIVQNLKGQLSCIHLVEPLHEMSAQILPVGCASVKVRALNHLRRIVIVNLSFRVIFGLREVLDL